MEDNDSCKKLEITIQTPQGGWETTCHSTDTVQEEINATIEKFGFSENGRYDLRLSTEPDNPLDPNLSLEKIKIKDGDTLIFTDLGVAV